MQFSHYLIRVYITNKGFVYAYYKNGKSIKMKLDKGVKVQILVQNKSGALLLKQATYLYVQQLFEFVAEVYRHDDGFFHEKVMVIDDEVVMLEMTNFDSRSFYVNAESNCFIYDKQVVSDVQEKRREDFGKTKKLSR